MKTKTEVDFELKRKIRTKRMEKEGSHTVIVKK
jgi:hypothetical protein